MAVHADPADALLRRLNGRPQACDPCRARKVRCDNAQPVCGICRRRSEDARCVYTRSERTAGGAPSLRGARGGAGPAASRRRRARNQSPPPQAPLPPPGAGYLGGFTSYSTVVNEARTTLRLLDPSSISSSSAAFASAPRAPRPPRPSSSSSSSSSSASASATALSPLATPTALHVLRHLPAPDHRAELVDAGGCHSTVWNLVASARVLDLLRRRYRHVLCRPARERTDEMLRPLADEIHRNTMRPLRDSVPDPAEFMDQFAGGGDGSLRWESLGLLFSHRELAPDVNGCGHHSNNDDNGQDGSSSTNSTAATRRARIVGGTGGQGAGGDSWPESGATCLRYCLRLARCITEGNVLVAWLSLRLMVVDSLVYGDASLVDWQTHGEAVTLLTYLGYHALPSSSSSSSSPAYVPCLAEEIKRWTFCALFNMDKVASSYHGRPPLLGHRYVSTPLPLDLDGDDLLAGGQRLRDAARDLDAAGWNRRGRLGVVTALRCRFLMSMIKNELIELALGNQTYTHVDTIRNIRARHLATHDSFPPFCKFRDADLDDPSLAAATLYWRLLIHLEHLQCLLFAERLLAKHGGGVDDDGGGLLVVSFEIVRHVLVFWLHGDRFDAMRVDFLWMVMSFGAPGGGVLCMELLRPTLPHRPLPPSPLPVTRSAIIQNLSLLAGFLGWIGPSAPNAELIINCKTVIQSVLDHVLNGTAGSSTAGVAARPVDGGSGAGGPEDNGYADHHGRGQMGGLEGLDGGMDLGFDLLGTFDWLGAEDALNLAGQPPGA